MIATKLFIGALASLVSFWQSWQFLSYGETAVAALVLAAIFVVVFEGVKLIAWAECFYRFKVGQSELGFWTLVLFVALFAMSIIATAHNLTVNRASEDAHVLAADRYYQDLRNQIAGLDASINSTESTINDCARRQLITKCVNPQTAILNGLRADRKAIQQQLSDYQPRTGSLSFWRSADNATAFDFIRAVLLDVVGLWLIGTALADARMRRGLAGAGIFVSEGVPDDERATHRSVDEWVAVLRSEGISKPPTIDQLKRRGMGQDKAQKVKAAFKVG